MAHHTPAQAFSYAIKGWDLAGQQAQHASECLAQLVSCHAFPSGDLAFEPGTAAQTEVLQLMVLGGWVCRKGEGYGLTPAGLNCLDYGPELLNRVPITHIPDGKALEDCTTFELVVMLTESGWVWRKPH
eukprot:12540-Alexandrium_andersonii.AAC.1